MDKEHSVCKSVGDTGEDGGNNWHQRYLPVLSLFRSRRASSLPSGGPSPRQGVSGLFDPTDLRPHGLRLGSDSVLLP